MNKFQSTEIKSKTLDQFTNNEPEEAPKSEGPDVVQLPKIEENNEPEIDEKEDLDDDVVEYQEPPLFEDECQCVPGLGKITKKSAGPQTEKPSTPGLFSNKTYILYGLMGVGLASQLLK